jgi:hypothetical protein
VDLDLPAVADHPLPVAALVTIPRAKTNVGIATETTIVIVEGTGIALEALNTGRFFELSVAVLKLTFLSAQRPGPRY